MMHPLRPIVETVCNEAHQLIYFTLGSFITYMVLKHLCVTKKPKCHYIHEFNNIQGDEWKRITSSLSKSKKSLSSGSGTTSKGTDQRVDSDSTSHTKTED